MDHSNNTKHSAVPEKSFKTYYPLLLVLSFVVAGAFYIESLSAHSSFQIDIWMNGFMGLFFCFLCLF